MVGLVLSVATIGCVKSDGTSTNQSGMMTLQLSNGTLTTRAVGTNDDTNNEDLIANAQVFFFNSDAADATVQHSYYTSIGQNQQASMSIPLSADQLTRLFTNNKSYVYVIANYGSEITGATTLAALKEKTITSTFGTDADGVQDSFIMDSELVEVTRGDANTITGEVFLTRAAAKVELTVNVAPITQDGKQWIADTANMRLSFNNGVSDGVIDDGSDEGAEPANGGTTFNIADRGFTLVTGEAGSGSFVQTVPFYSYSTKWTAGAENEVYLELAIPWRVQEQSASESEAGADSEDVSKLTYQTFYYQVPVSVDDLSLVRNAYYKLTLDVGVLGGLTERVTVEPSYVVINWGTNEVNVNLSRPKYLVVDENSVIMNNVNSYSVAYQSSDRITAVITSIIKPNLSGNTATYPDIINTNHGFSISTTGENGGVITLNHTLQNDNTMDNYDYVPYTVTVEVTMTVGTSTFKETIVFTQYPAMYITADQNTDYTDGSSTSDKYGYVFLNGNRYSSSWTGGSYTGGGSYWGSITGLSGSNANPNMYVINVSSLDSNDYLIGDPRCLDGSETVSLDRNESRDSAPNLSSGQTVTGPQNYLPTSANTPTVIAPKFRIASSYGKTSGITFAAAKKRCASYQEDGFPAGRWRVPTKAEIAYITKLSANDYIPILFNNGGNYWNASGTITSPNNDTGEVSDKTSGSNVFVRCVYDEWYWSDKCDINTFTWGDAPRPTN